MTSREAFEAWWQQHGQFGSYSQQLMGWQAAIEWAQKQIQEAIAGVRASEEDDTCNQRGNDIAAKCETASKKALK